VCLKNMKANLFKAHQVGHDSRYQEAWHRRRVIRLVSSFLTIDASSFSSNCRARCLIPHPGADTWSEEMDAGLKFCWSEAK
jgi:hypothetical protein